MSFTHTIVQPVQSACANRNCYCFMGMNPMDWPTDDDDASSISSTPSSVTLAVEDEDEYADMPALIRASIEPFLEPAPILNAGAAEFQPDEDVNWVVTVSDITFRHPRALLAYFRMVNLVNEVARYSWERIEIPPLSHETCHTILNHTSVQNTPPEFEEDVRELYRFVVENALISH